MFAALRIDCDGNVHNVMFNHLRPQDHLLPPLTFVGAIPDLNGVAIAHAGSDGLPLNRHSFGDDIIGEKIVHGDIFIVGSDRNGEAVSLDTELVRARLMDALKRSTETTRSDSP